VNKNMKMQNSKRKMQNTKEFINKAIFKHPPLKGGEIIDPLSLEGRG